MFTDPHGGRRRGEGGRGPFFLHLAHVLFDTRFVRRPHVSFDAETLAFVSNTPLSQETMNELLQSAEFLVHVAVPGAAAKPAIETIGGDAPSWDVEGGGA